MRRETQWDLLGHLSVKQITPRARGLNCFLVVGMYGPDFGTWAWDLRACKRIAVKVGSCEGIFNKKRA